jgi:hypothetical protein
LKYCSAIASAVLFCATTAILAYRTGVLPRWLAGAAAVTAVALAVNGAFLEASFLPALLLFIAWTLAASLCLIRRAWQQADPIVEPRAAAAA